MLFQHGIELFDLGLQGSAWQPKEDDAGVGEALVEAVSVKVVAA
jgi:hypothetical protein